MQIPGESFPPTWSESVLLSSGVVTASFGVSVKGHWAQLVKPQTSWCLITISGYRRDSGCAITTTEASREAALRRVGPKPTREGRGLLAARTLCFMAVGRAGSMEAGSST